jgi:hypothetical protein
VNRTSLIIPIALAVIPAGAAAQGQELPFDLTQADLVAVDTAAFNWKVARASVGGVEGEFLYAGAEPPTEGECRAAALMGMLRLRNYYRSQNQDELISIRMNFRCAALYGGLLEYDGVVLTLEIKDAATGDVLYRKSRRGLP